MKQQEVLALMNDGWELYYGSGSRGDGSTRLQQGGAGRGGKAVTVSRTVLDALIRKGLVETVPRTNREPFWRTRYRIKKP